MTKRIKYDFFSECGGAYIETFTTSQPAAYASELAALLLIDPDEVTWEPAEVAVKSGAGFPQPITKAEQTLSAENDRLVADVMRLECEVEKVREFAEFWQEMYSNLHKKITTIKEMTE